MSVSHSTRKHGAFNFSQNDRGFALACVAALILAVCPHWGHTATPVAITTVHAEPGYEVARTYAGRLVPRRTSELGFRYAGTIASFTVDIGDTVVARQRLASLDTASLEADLAEADATVEHAAASLRAAEADVQLARQTEARFRQLREVDHASAQTYDERLLDLRAKEARVAVAKAAIAQAVARRRRAEVALADAHIEAPYAGTIQARFTDEGTQAIAGQPALRLLERSAPEVHVGVPETLAPMLDVGARHPLLWRGRELEGELETVLPELDPASRTLTAVFALGEEDVPAGALVELALRQQVPVPGFWVPMTALAESERGLWSVYAVNDRSIVERRIVEVVHAEAQRVFVRGSLRDGESIVETGIDRVVPGQAVVAALGTARAASAAP